MGIWESGIHRHCDAVKRNIAIGLMLPQATTMA